MELARRPSPRLLDNYRNGKEEMGLWYWGPDYPGPDDYLAFLPGSLAANRANWGAGADKALEALGARRPSDRRRRASRGALPADPAAA